MAMCCWSDEDECEGFNGISMFAEWYQALTVGVGTLDMTLSIESLRVVLSVTKTNRFGVVLCTG